MDGDDNPPVVLDLGSCTTKVGLADQGRPRSHLSLIADKPGTFVHNPADKVFFEDALNCDSAQNFRYPLQRGKVVDWEDMDDFIYQAIIFGAGVNPEDRAVLISEPPLNAKIVKEKMAQIIFEKMSVPYLHIACQDVLSMYSSDRTTGLMLSSGNGVTSITAIQDGFKVADQVKRLDVVGHDLTVKVEDALAKQGLYFKDIADYPKIQNIKESLCYVSVDPNTENSTEKTFELPDGETVSLGEQAYRIPELMFTPTDLESVSFPRAVYDTIMKCDVSMRKHLYSNIILCGGNTMFPGFVERMDQELGRLVPSSISVETVPHDHRINSVWLGGAILASLSTFKKICVTKSEYEEFGPSIVHRKP